MWRAMDRSAPPMTFALSLLLAATVACGQAQPGLRFKIVSRSEFHSPGAPPPSETTAVVYASGPNTRIEPQSPVDHSQLRLITIQRCADHVAYALNPDTREYMELPLPSAPPSESAPAETNAAKTTAPNVTFDITTVDTGETKKVFGHTARHYVTTTKQPSAPELRSDSSETVDDVWYLDIPDVMQCNRASHRPHGIIGAGVGAGVRRDATPQPPRPIPEFRFHGPDPAGLTLSSQSTTRETRHYVYGEAYEVSTTRTSQIVQLEETRIDPALFEVPKNFTKVVNFTRK